MAGFGGVAADYAGVGAEVNEGADLGAADAAGAAGAEEDFVFWGWECWYVSTGKLGGSLLTEDAILPHVAEVVAFLDGHGGCVVGLMNDGETCEWKTNFKIP